MDEIGAARAHFWCVREMRKPRIIHLPRQGLAHVDPLSIVILDDFSLNVFSRLLVSILTEMIFLAQSVEESKYVYHAVVPEFGVRPICKAHRHSGL
jgi:hypothetical protein